MTKRKSKQQPKQPVKLNLASRKPTLAEVVADQGGAQRAPAEQRSWKPGDKKPSFAEAQAAGMLQESAQERLLRQAQEEDAADRLIWVNSKMPVHERLAAHMRMVKRRYSGQIRD